MVILSFFFYIILFFVLFVLVTVGVLIFRFWNVIRMVFGGQQSAGTYARREQQSTTGTDRTSVGGEPQQRTSPFDKNEGEYVDFEEIKD